MPEPRKERPVVPPKPAHLSTGSLPAQRTAGALSSTRLAPDPYNVVGVDNLHEASQVSGDPLVVEVIEVKPDYTTWSVTRTRSQAYRRSLAMRPFLASDGKLAEDAISTGESDRVKTWRWKPNKQSAERLWLESSEKRQDSPLGVVLAKVLLALDELYTCKPWIYGILDDRQLNRLSAFVRSGIEEYLLDRAAIGSMHRAINSSSTGGAALYFIEHGPAWHSEIRPFEISVAIATTTAPNARHQPTLYEVKSTFTADTNIIIIVHRRFSQFEALHQALMATFPLAVLPSLPEKYLRFNPERPHIYRRRLELETYVQRLVRHPLIRDTDLLTTFLAAENCSSWENVCDVWRCRGREHNFLANVIHPDWNHEDGDPEYVQCLNHKFREAQEQMGILALAFVNIRDQTIDYSTGLSAMSLQLAELAVNRGIFAKDEQVVGDAILHSSYLLSETNGALDMIGCTYRQAISMLDEWKHGHVQYKNLASMHGAVLERLRHAKLHNIVQYENFEARSDTILNVLLAEMHALDQQLIEDLRNLSEWTRYAQMAYHQKAIKILSQRMTFPLSMTDRRGLLDKIECTAQRRPQPSEDSSANLLDSAASSLIRFVRPYLG